VDLDFTLERGRSIAIMGPSGSGKSTLLNVLAGMVRPQAGSVSLFGATWADGTAAMRSMRGKFIGVVPQRAELLNELTVVENVALPLLLDGVDFSSAVAAAKPIMSRLGILSIAKGGPSTISAGEAQRTAIARALIRNPTLVIADEPTSALDADNAGIVAQILSAGDEGRACIMMTHDEVVARHCDASMQLKDGSLHLMART
jgi:putative ABC transport system ATP-binding protein